MIYDLESDEIHKADKFAQLYFKDISKLFGLSNTGYNMLMLMSKSIGLGNTNSIDMTTRRKKEFAAAMGCTVRQINNQLKVMVDNDVAKITDPDVYRNRYTINPDIIFSGNEYQKVRILMEYSNGERKLKSFSSEEALGRFIRDEEEAAQLAKERNNNGK